MTDKHALAKLATLTAAIAMAAKEDGGGTYLGGGPFIPREPRPGKRCPECWRSDGEHNSRCPFKKET